MWLTGIMEVLFAGAMVSVVVDTGRARLGGRRVLAVGAVAAVSLSACLAEFLANWSQAQSGPVTATPVVSAFATLYTVDKFGALVILTVLVVGLAVAVYSATSVGERDNVGLFFALLQIIVACAVGLVSAGDLLTVFLFWEGVSISAYGLVSFERRDVSLEAAMKYFFMAASGSLIYLYGVALTYSAIGSIRLSELPLLLSSGSLGLASLLLMLLGLGVEAALFPVHMWLPDAYGSSPALTGALHGRVVNEAVLFAMLKVVQPLVPYAGSDLVRGAQVALVAVAAMTMLVGNLGAMGQTNVRRMLAFSSVAQMGYMLAALSTFTVLGLAAVAFLIWNQGIVKASFFMLTGAGGKDYEGAELDRLEGLGQSSKTLGVLFSSSALAMVGSPPFGTFWAELLAVEALLSVGTDMFFGLAVVLVLNIVLSIAYYFRVVNRVALVSVEGKEAEPMKPSFLLPPVALLALSVLTGLVPALILGTIL